MSAKKKTSGKARTASKKNVQPVGGTFFSSPLFIHGLIWSVLFAFTGLFMYINTDAVIAEAIRGTLGGLFGIMSFLIPVIFLGTLGYLVYYRSVSGMWIKFILSVCALTDMSAIIGLFADYDASVAFEMCSEYMNGGGLVGVAASSFLSKLIGPAASFVLLAVLFVVFGCLITRVNLIPYLVRYFKMLLGYSADMGGRMKQRTEEYVRRRREEAETAGVRDAEEGYEPRKGPSYVPPEEDELPMSLSERRRKQKAEPEREERRRSGDPTIDIANGFAEDIGTAAAEPVPDIFGDDTGGGDFDLYNMRFDDEPETEAVPEEIETMPESGTPEPEGQDETDEEGEEGTGEEDYASSEILKDMNVSQMADVQKAKNLTDGEKQSFHSELDRAMSEPAAEYRFPTLELLDAPVRVSSDQRRELYKKAEQLIAVLDNFGVKAKPVQVTQGPTVTRYEIQPSSGTKLSKIVNLADDIALNMAVATVLIAPVPGKAATVGVEIPNTNVTPVKIREMLESSEFINAKSKLTVCLGKDIGGNVVVGDIAKWPHALIAGATGSGKSVCINTIITSILYKASPNEVKLIMIDPKQVELGVYNGIPHLLVPVVTEAKKAAGALNWAVSEMMNRYDMFKNSGVRKLETYNKLMEKTGGEKLPQIVIIIDELADLMMIAAKEVEDYVCRLAQLARAAGIHLIIATQRPSVDVITGLIKANIPSRIAFFVSQQVDSRTILDKAGAEKLLGMGDMLYYPTGARATTRVQGAFVSDGEVERIVDYIKSTSPQTHYSEDLEEHIERIALGENGVTPDTEDDGDALLPDAIKLAVELGKISTSMIQRRLGVGYSRAGRIIDQMEARGIVSPANGSKPRDVLVSHADMPFDSDGGEI